ncbi:response regulator [Mucilaginibacter sp. 21P]|uniref:response regulator n=1 Tax=Mucilaginibacter sp. 21P TaxID=2778902 RepID=UPI001C58BD42|nr:response regulator [Mucilaginibacter sp. 21P]QXV63641.1 response regulator [Mucilaginibacter sp. 21P]
MIKKKILVCDDDQDILDLVDLVLSDDYQVKTEIDSTRLMRNADAFRPDLILLDMWMPKITGDQLTRYIKNQPVTKEIPVIIFSASKDGESKAMDAGANAFIAKPFDLDELNELIGRLC